VTKRVAKSTAKRKKVRQEWPLVVYIWAMSLGLLGYLIVGRFVLASRPHPVHWAAGVVGVVLGVPVGWLWYRWRGDVL